jgi:MFS family permease
MDGITYVVAFFLVLVIKYSPQVQEKIDEGSIFQRMKMGMDYFKNHKVIFVFGNCSFSIFVILLVEVHLLLAWYVNNHLHEGADVYAFAEVFYAVGALFAGLAIRKLFRGTNTVLSVIILMGVTVAGLFWVSFSQQCWIFYVFSILIGVTNAGTRVLRTTWLFEHVPNNVMGRVGSVFNVLNIFQRLLFGIIFSLAFFSSGSNVIWAYFIGGIFVLMNMLPIIFYYGKLSGRK